MKAYLIDFENVSSKGLSGIEKLGSEDYVYIFYSNNSDTISFDMHRMVMESKAKIDYIKVSVGGKNALDFQLSTFLGYLEAKGEFSRIFVISGDKGFDFLNNFWNQNKTDGKSSLVYRVKTISGAINLANNSDENDEQIDYENLEFSAPDIVEDTEENETEKSMEEVASSPEFAAESVDFSETEKEYSIDKSKGYTENVRMLLKDKLKDIQYVNLVSCLFMQSNDKGDFHKSLQKHFGKDAAEIYRRFSSDYDALKKIRQNEKKKSAENKNAQKQAEAKKQKAEPVKTVKKTVSSNIVNLLKDICTEDEIKYVGEQINAALTKQQLYIRMIKAFKKDKGLKIYGAVKGEYSNLHSEGK